MDATAPSAFTATGSLARIISFEPKYQSQVVDLFIYGLSSYKSHVTANIAKAQAAFIESKLAPDGGDMFDVQKTYMLGPSTSHFWVAVNDEDKVLGIVGTIASTYKSSNTIVYNRPELHPGNVCELVRMSVHPEARGMGLGKQLCATVEAFGREHGMLKVVLSTLAAMHLAVGLYVRCGFTLMEEEQLHANGIDMVVAHYGKDLQSAARRGVMTAAVTVQ